MKTAVFLSGKVKTNQFSYLLPLVNGGGLGEGDAGLLLFLPATRSAELHLADGLGGVLVSALKVHLAFHPEED